MQQNGGGGDRRGNGNAIGGYLTFCRTPHIMKGRTTGGLPCCFLSFSVFFFVIQNIFDPFDQLRKSIVRLPKRI